MTTALVAVLGASPVHASNPCVVAAKDVFKEAKATCKENFQVAKDACLNRDHDCVEACRADREDCRAASGIDTDLAACASGLATAIAQCNATRDAGIAACNGDDACIDQVQVVAFQCRDTAHENSPPDLQACRDTFHACIQACPPSSPSGAFLDWRKIGTRFVSGGSRRDPGPPPVSGRRLDGAAPPAVGGRMQRESTADAVIVGADLAGLVVGAILTRHGQRVVVLEHADTVGGRGGAVQTPDGFWIDFGHRDAHGVGDCQFPWHHGAEAAREAGVEIASRPITRPLRVHRLADGTVLDGGDWTAGGFLAAAREFFECPADGVAELQDVLARLAAALPDEVAGALPVRLGPWVEQHVQHPGVRRALLLMAAVIFHPRPAEASAGRLMQFFQTPKGLPHIADDAEAGGMQGLMEPWARAIRARGGEIALGWKPVEIIVDGGRVHGAVAVDRTNLVREVRAPVVVTTYPVWENFDLIDARRFPPAFVAAAEELKRYRADLIGWQAGLRRVPTVRATGRADDHAGWNRFLLGGPGERRYAGGYHIPSLTSRRAAPAGRHLLSWVMARFFDGGTTSGPPWTAARAHLDMAAAYLKRYYADLDDCLEWSAYQYVAAPQSMSWSWAPVRRHDLTVPGMDGLLLASATLEAPAGIVDIGAYAGRAAAHAALERLGAAR